MKTALVLPILLPLVTAVALVFAGDRRAVQRLSSLIGNAALFAAGVWLLWLVDERGIIAVQIGKWPAPFGITLVADVFAALMVAVTGFVALSVGIYAQASMDEERERFGFYPLYHVLLTGVCGAFLTGDLFNLFVWIEVMLMASFVLLALGGGRAQIEGSVKYMTLNFIASGFLLTAIGILYGKTGTLNMAHLAVRVGQGEASVLILPAAVLLFMAFGIKAGVFPLFFWLPASYHTPPIAVSAVFAGLLTKVGVYALVRIFTLIYTGDNSFIQNLILAVAGLTMVTGVLGAAAQFEFRRILSFHIISQIGYMILGLGLFTTAAIAGSIFYIVHHIIVKTNLFLISGAVHQIRGSYELKNLGGLYRDRPWLSLLFLIPALSLAGIPPLSGFFAKFALVKAGLDIGSYTLIAVALVVGLLTLFSMTKIWAEAFWKAAPNTSQQAARSLPLRMAGPIVAMAVATLAISIFPQWLFGLATRAAEQLKNPSDYIQVVLSAAR